MTAAGTDCPALPMTKFAAVASWSATASCVKFSGLPKRSFFPIWLWAGSMPVQTSAKATTPSRAGRQQESVMMTAMREETEETEESDHSTSSSWPRGESEERLPIFGFVGFFGFLGFLPDNSNCIRKIRTERTGSSGHPMAYPGSMFYLSSPAFGQSKRPVFIHA